MESVCNRWAWRPLTLADVPALLPWYNDRDLHAIVYTREFAPYTLDELMMHWQKRLHRPLARYDAILLDGEVIGRVGLVRKPPHVEVAEYSILIGPQALQGRGLGTLITARVIDEAFREDTERDPQVPPVQIVRLYVRADNLRAIRCYEKAGVRREYAFKQNGVPTIMMQIDRREWQAVKEKGRNDDDERSDRLERQA
ncbi:MAG TPA: GNAT family N-acetyltransferase [Bacilli bacterium]|nr:GNAT family N-acetyltransferase [Bacilli bacterium]